MRTAVRKKKKKGTWKRVLAVLAAILVLFIGWIIWDNNRITNTVYEVHADIPAAFEGYRIVQLSDLHDACFGKDNARLIQAVADAAPDVIVLTGDNIDADRFKPEQALDFIRSLCAIAPVYAIGGNHESSIPGADYDALKQGIADAGAVFMENTFVDLERGGASIRLIGLTDFQKLTGNSKERLAESKAFTERSVTDGFDVVLNHSPKYIESYTPFAPELMLCGHLHGGQFRLPFLGGVYVPNFGFFPQYDAGMYTVNQTKMIVSRGLGNSTFPFRINNCPEIVTVILRQNEEQ